MTLIRYRPRTAMFPRRSLPFRAMMESGMANDTWVPQVDVRETEKEFVIEADLPGFGKDQVRIDLEDDVLTIRAEKDQAAEENREGYHRVERRHGSFKRSFMVPDSVAADKIGAKSEDGVLTVTLPKVKEKQGARVRSIKIR